MKRIIIDLPDELADRVNESRILDMIEDGAAYHALIIRRIEGTSDTIVRHSRLGVTIETRYTP